MSQNPGVQLEDGEVLVFNGDKRLYKIEAWDLSDPSNQLAYAQLIMLRALIERQSLMAGALAQLVALINERSRAADPNAALDAAVSRVSGLMEKFGLKPPVVPGS